MLGIVAVAWPSRFGGPTTMLVVHGDSMLPIAHTGDLVIARSKPHYRVGEVVVFDLGGTPKPVRVMHRIVSVTPDGSFVTRGDNRSTDDGFLTEPGNVLGATQWIIPRGGLFLWLASRWWMLAIIGGLLITVVTWGVGDRDDQAAETNPASV